MLNLQFNKNWRIFYYDLIILISDTSSPSFYPNMADRTSERDSKSPSDVSSVVSSVKVPDSKIPDFSQFNVNGNWCDIVEEFEEPTATGSVAKID